VRFNPKRLKVRSVCASKSEFKLRPKFKDVFRNGEQLVEENKRLMTTLQSTRSKIECWTSRKVLTLHEMIRQRKREEELKILAKFK
jgi:hypothetical protein